MIGSCLCLTKLKHTKLQCEHAAQVRYLLSGTVSVSSGKTNSDGVESLGERHLKLQTPESFPVLLEKPNKTLSCFPTYG